jgi:hypothetical protein
MRLLGFEPKTTYSKPPAPPAKGLRSDKRYEFSFRGTTE